MPDKIIIFGKKSIIKADTTWISESDFYKPTLDRETITRTLEELKRIQRSHINGNKIPSLFVYEDISIWWFFFMPLFYKINSAIDFIVNFSNFLDKINPSVIEIEDFSKLEIIKQICKKKKISIKFSEINFLLFKLKLKIKNIVRKRTAKKRTKLKIQKRLNLFKKKFSSRSSLDGKILISASSVYRRDIFNSKSKKSERGEWLIQNVVDLLEDGESIIGLDYSPQIEENEKILEERLNSPISWFPAESLFFKKDNSKKHSIFFEKYEKILSMPQFQQLFMYDEISFWNEAESIFKEFLHWYHIPSWLEFFDSYLRLFSLEKPKAIFITYERGPIGLSLIAAAKRYGIKTICLSHEIIYDNHEGFSHEDFATSTNPHGYLLPDITLLFGEYSKEVLKKHGYPLNYFIVFGNPYYFNLKQIEESMEEKPLRKKYKILPDHKVILFTTEKLQEFYTGQGKFDYDVKIWKKLIDVFANKKNYTLILKPHPAESNIIAYEKILKSCDPQSVKIIQDDLLELIFMSDVVISVYSNSMMDAIVLKKPVIRVEFVDIKHPIPYEDFDVILSTSLDDLSDAINRVIEDEKIQTILREKRTKFIKYQYNIPIENPEVILRKILN